MVAGDEKQGNVMLDDQDRILTPTEAASYKRISTDTLRRQVKAGLYERVWLSKTHWGVRLSALRAQHTEPPEAA